MDSDQIQLFVEQLEKEANRIREECINLAWAMRGGIQYTDAMNLSRPERDMIHKLAKDNLEITKKSGLPFF